MLTGKAYSADYYARNKHKWKAYNKRNRKKFREWYDGLKERPCEDCDEEFDPVCMQWDHRGTDKLMAVGALAHTWNKTLILAEIAKCDLVCANRHALRTKARHRSNEIAD